MRTIACDEDVIGKWKKRRNMAQGMCLLVVYIFVYSEEASSHWDASELADVGIRNTATTT